jgi:hypothetical protein
MPNGTHRQILFVLVAAAARSLAELVPQVTLGDADESLAVSFTYGNRSCQYSLTATSTFAADANIVVHSETGTQQQPHPEAITFTTREPGNWATAILEKSNNSSRMKVSGLFWCEDVLIDIPAHGMSSGFARQLDSLDVAGDAGHRRMQDGRRLVGSVATKASQSGYRIADETDGLKLQPASFENVLASGSWNGVRWFPGCYTGDSQPHVFKIGFVVDAAAARKHGNSLNSLVQTVVARTSFIYESQLNIKVEIGDLQIYTSDTGAPSHASGCLGIYQQLDRLTSAASSGQIPFNGARHLLTGCGSGSGVVGLAYVGTICTATHNTGVNQLHNEMSWVIFAHELGHNFGGDHSFEEGQGRTGGIMDYGDGRLNGEYQFNTRYRKDQMCRVMNSVANRCQGKFDAGGGSPTPNPSPTPPSSGSCSYGVDACRAAAERLNLITSGTGSYGFSGVYSETGCYAYNTGALNGYAWYGLRSDGSEVQGESELSAVQSGKYRLDGTHSCGSGGNDGDSQCKDLNDNCPAWGSHGFCSGQYEEYMSTNCKKTCNRCPRGPVNCKDDYSQCLAWSSRGYCTSGAYVEFMRSFCQQSCNTCGLVAYSKSSMQAPEDAPGAQPTDADLLSGSTLIAPGHFAAPMAIATIFVYSI